MTDRTRTLLTRLDEAPVGAPPLPELLRVGRAARRRRRVATVLAGGLGVVLVAALGVVTLGGGGPDRASDRGLAVTAPPGTTYVGIGRAVVAVPDDWTLSTASCVRSATEVYYYPQPTDGVCRSIDAKTSTLAITAQKPAWDGQNLPKAGPVGGYGVVDTGLECLDSLPPHCSEVVGVPSLDAYFTIDSSTVDAEKVIAAIRSSLTVLPEGQMALPNVPPLEGTWKVVGLIGPDGQSLLDDSQRGTVTLTFHDGMLGGATPCNGIGGHYRQDGQDVRFSPFETQVACGEPPVVPRLLAVRHVSTANGHLHLHAANWMIVVDLVQG